MLFVEKLSFLYKTCVFFGIQQLSMNPAFLKLMHVHVKTRSLQINHFTLRKKIESMERNETISSLYIVEFGQFSALSLLHKLEIEIINV